MSAVCSFFTLIGRIFISLVFLWSGISSVLHFEEAVQLLEAHSVPSAGIIAIIACIVEFVGGISLLLGFKARWGAGLLFLFLIPATLMFHDFWMFDGQEGHLQKLIFMKNIAIMGGLLYVLSCGAGSCSFDGRCASKGE